MEWDGDSNPRSMDTQSTFSIWLNINNAQFSHWPNGSFCLIWLDDRDPMINMDIQKVNGYVLKTVSSSDTFLRQQQGPRLFINLNSLYDQACPRLLRGLRQQTEVGHKSNNDMCLKLKTFCRKRKTQIHHLTPWGSIRHLNCFVINT